MMFKIPNRRISILFGFLVTLLTLLAYSESSPADQPIKPGCRQLKSIGPGQNSPDISWITPVNNADQAKLDQWCQTVGPALFRAPLQPEKRHAGTILLVNWNMHVGNGDIESLIDELQAQERTAGHDQPDFVFLLQEVFRRGADVPATVAAGASIPSRIPSPDSDIQAVAAKLDWWLFYAPSMRNGKRGAAEAEDRGNAILSSLPLESLQAIELPFSVQRRVAVSATVHDVARRYRFSATAVHLDTRAPLDRGFIFGAASARNRQAQWLSAAVRKSAETGASLFIGGDLNSYFGPLESSVDTLARAAARVDCGTGATHSTGLKLDHIFARISSPLDVGACRRLSTRFESDHYPLVLPISANPENLPAR